MLFACSVKIDIVAIEHIFWECELNDFSTLKKKEIFTVTDTSVDFVEKEFIFGSLVKLYKIKYVIA